MDTNMADLMQLLADKMGGDSSKLDSILNMVQSSTSNNSSTDNTSTDIPDIETILKIKKVIDSVNSNANDPNVALLSSLKPYLRDGKKAKIDQYIKIMNMTKAMALFSDLGGDSK
jgi:hypothetical protein